MQREMGYSEDHPHPEEDELAWLTMKCKARVGPLELPCKGEMKYDKVEMVFVCQDCGNKTGFL